jgi:hypothetical protein
MGWSAFRQTGLTFHNPNQSVKGYTLFVPTRAEDVYLIDMAGQIVKTWRFDDVEPGLPKLLSNGHLLLSCTDKATAARARQLEKDDYSDLELLALRLGGGYNTLREYDFEGNLLWSYSTATMHHDFHLCPNGDILAPHWEVMPDEAAKKVRGGVKKRGKQSPMFGDNIIRVNRAGEEVERWRLWQMFDPRKDPINPMVSRLEWMHVNSVDLSEEGQLLVSCRHNSRVALIDMAAHEITWKYAEPEISLQHHATFVPGGNIQVFDNSLHKALGSATSQILEIDPKSNDIVWRYQPAVPEQFFSGHLGGAQRLPLGNVLVCEGTSGRLFEVTRKGEIVWEWINPFVFGTPDGRQFTWIYRAYRYPMDYPGLQGKELNPEAYRGLNVAHGLG